MTRACSKAVLYIVAIVVLLLPALSAEATHPQLFINESGNISDAANILNGSFTIERGYQYNSFLAALGNYSYFNVSIPRGETVFIAYERTFNETPFSESITHTKNLTVLTVQYAISHIFDGSADVQQHIPIPAFCEYKNTTSSSTIDAERLVNDTLILEYTIAERSAQLINVTCEASSSGSQTFPASSYLIDAERIAPDYEFNILPRSYFSVTKDPQQVIITNTSLGNESNESNQITQTWHSDFTFTNADEISLLIEKVKLWAVPIVNRTDDPVENVIFNATYTSCDNSPDGILDTGEECRIFTMFNSFYVPVIWNEVSYNAAWDYDVSTNYSFDGNATTYDFDFFQVTLEYPENDTYVNLNASVDLGFSVSTPSDCSLYTTMSGSWTEHNMTLENVTEGNYTVWASNTTSSFDWNVFCRATDGYDANFADENFTVNVNAIHEHYANITNITMPEDTNYTLNMSDYFVDLESDDLNFSHVPASVLNITFIADNASDRVTIVPDQDFNGVRLAKIVAIDPYGRNVTSNLFRINITPVADPPRITFWNITNGTWWTTNETEIETKENVTLNFTAEAYDPDEPSVFLQFLWYVDGILQDIGQLFSWYVDFFQQGVRNVTLVVNDSTGLYDIQTWIVNVTNVNVPPNVTAIPDLAWEQNTTLVVNLSIWFSDIDAEDALLNYLYNGSLANLTVVIDQNTSMMSITPDTGWTGINERWMSINATDAANHTVQSNIFNLTVYPYILKDIPDVAFEEDMWNDTINLSEYYNEQNYSWADLSWTAYGAQLTFLFTSSGILNITSDPDWFGNTTATLWVRDPHLWNDSDTFNVEVLPVNDAPEISGGTYSIVENSTPPHRWVDLWSHSSDVDNNLTELSYSILSQSDPWLLGCSIIDSRYLNCTPPPTREWGENLVNVSVSDGELTDSAIFTLRVLHDNQAPIIERWNMTSETFALDETDGITSVEILENTTLNFSTYTSDLENDNLSSWWYFNGSLISTSSLASLYFDFHSSGSYTVRYLVNQSDGQYDEIEWNITVVNLNRPPYPVNLTNPDDDAFLTDLFTFNWSNTTDPDKENHNEDDLWEFVYILQVDDDPSFLYPELEMQFTNITSFTLDTVLPDDRYYWRVLAYDGSDASISEERTFILDLNAPELELDIAPLVAEYGIRDVDVEWSVSDMHLDEAYVNISYPNGTLLGQYNSNVTLTPAELVDLGTYEALLYASDLVNHTSTLSKTFSVVNDTDPPSVTLVDPGDNTVLSTDTAIFNYRYEDINELANCTLYFQEMDIIYDVVGGIIHMEELTPWTPVAVDTSIELEDNYFIHGPLEDSSYKWNVLCYDRSGNGAFAPKNWTFRVQTEVKDVPIPTYPFDNESFKEIYSPDGSNLNMKIFPADSLTGEVVTGKMQIENTGKARFSSLSFLPSVDWVFFNDTVVSLDPGQKRNISYTIWSPLYPGEYLYHIVALGPELRKLASGYLEVSDDADVPLRIIKRVYLKDDVYNVSLTLINYLPREIDIYLEESLETMKGVQYPPDAFLTSGTAPPYMSMARNYLAPRETYTVSYRVNELDERSLSKPTVLVNVDHEVSMEIISPHTFTMLQYRKTQMEIIMIVSFVVILLLLFALYGYILIRRRREYYDSL